MSLNKLFTALFLMLCVTGFCMSNVAAGKQGDTYLTVHVGETIKQGTKGYDGIIVKPHGDTASYVNAKFYGKNDMRYTGLKTTVGAVDFDVGKKIIIGFFYNTVHVTVLP
ncbi:MAG: hypothetical protein LBD03_01310 [Methanobrevibacter sp.]|jgi:hypothetical protein|nr:hypothetical protein [Candidatus Methanovirga procula]